MVEFERKFIGSGGIELVAKEWTVATPKARVIITHGFAEHLGRYSRLASDLNDKNIACYSFDLRGHGKSPGIRGYIESFQQYYGDLSTYVELVSQQHPTVPLFLFGHSLGGLLVFRYIQDFRPAGIRGVILSSPLFGVAVKIPKTKRIALPALKWLIPTLTLHNEIDSNNLSHDEAICEGYRTDPLVHTRASATFFYELLQEMEIAKDKAPQWTHPIIVQYAGDDRIVDQNATEAICKLIPPQYLTQIKYDSFFHEIFNEIERQKPINDLISWINQRI
ncbi:MAG TPA: lysophospholipase [Bdellovibrionota bacterium]|nr:lysophospholipase [Bdellovibrionota bacterium]